ncbi:MAG: putative porin, partial [Desulfatiglandales bacterium]
VKSDADREDTGYLYGVSVGTKKVQKLGDWELKYNYRKLEADAWPAAFPDSDFYGGATNVKGHELELTLGIKKYVTLGFDYYKAKPIKKLNGLDPYNDEKLLQVDLVVKW